MVYGLWMVHVPGAHASLFLFSLPLLYPLYPQKVSSWSSCSYLLALSLAADAAELSATGRRGTRRVGPLPATGIAAAVVLVALGSGALSQWLNNQDRPIYSYRNPRLQ